MVQNGDDSSKVDIPRDVLQNALREKLKSPELTVVDVDIFRPDEIKGNNFGSYVRHLTVKYVSSPGDDTPKSLPLFMKTMGDTDFHVNVESSSNICQREFVVFTKVHPALRKVGVLDIDAVTPICYYADEKTAVLENLVHSGYEMRLVQDPHDMAHVKLVITALAEYHAASYALKKQISPKRVTDEFHILTEPCYKKENEHSFGDMIARTCNNLITTLSEFPQCKELVPALKKLLPSYFDLGIKTVQEEEPFNVICHGDPWSNNIMFKYVDGSPRAVKMLDYQISRYAPAATDLIYYLYSSTDHKFRSKHTEAILQYYYSHFVVSIAALGYDKCDFTYEQFKKNYLERVLYCVPVLNFFLISRYTSKDMIPDIESTTDGANFEENMGKMFTNTLSGKSKEAIAVEYAAVFEDIKQELEKWFKSIN